MKSDKTLEYVKDNFKAKYKQKRYPKKKDQKNPLPITELKKILLHVREMAKKNGNYFMEKLNNLMNEFSFELNRRCAVHCTVSACEGP